MSNITGKADNLTVSRVYETLKSPTFLKNLYWDILSGVKEKNTYKLMRGIAEGLINQNMKGIDDLGDNEMDNIRRRAIVAEISVMSYTIDKVFSKILYMKLEKACKEQIVKIIHELKEEGKIPENVWSKINLNTEASGPQTSTENSLVKMNSVQVNKEVKRFPTRVGKRRRTTTSKNVLQNIKRANTNKGILDDLAKVNNLKYTDKDESIINGKKGHSSKKKVEGITKECPKKNLECPQKNPITYPNASSAEANFPVLPNSVNNNIISKDLFESGDVSDIDSEISFGGETVVSSVHTSDLSSFDDEISLSSDDENGQKKKLSLKEVQEIFFQNNVLNSSTNKKNDVESLNSKIQEKPSERVTEDKNKTKEEKPSERFTEDKNKTKEEKPSERITENKNKTKEEKPSERVTEDKNKTKEEKPSERVTEDKNKTKEVLVNNADKNTKECTLSESSNENTLPKRARKPNSRYTSDNILCPVVRVKERHAASIKTYSKVSNDQFSPQSKKIKVDENYGDVVTITKSVNNEETSNNTKTPAKQPETMDLFKSHSAKRSLTSRRTAPLTLFST